MAAHNSKDIVSRVNFLSGTRSGLPSGLVAPYLNKTNVEQRDERMPVWECALPLMSSKERNWYRFRPRVASAGQVSSGGSPRPPNGRSEALIE